MGITELACGTGPITTQKQFPLPDASVASAPSRTGGGGGGGVGTRPWWLALLACGGAYWPLAFFSGGGGGISNGYRTRIHPRDTGIWS